MALFRSEGGAARRREAASLCASPRRRASGIRARLDSWEDSYLRPEEQPERPSLCEACGAVFANHRWYESAVAPMTKSALERLPRVICPADRRRRDHVPGGVVTLRGTFVETHWHELEELVKGEERKARADNPMERLLEWHFGAAEVSVDTTNPKLAQRIGRRLERSYLGSVTYRWAGDDHLARVTWSRQG